jgi:creatinine amidohydrolase/Fe(II)-dependent formamide hydrolase-like protein
LFIQIFVLAGHYPNADIAKLASKKFADKDIKIVVVKEPDLVDGELGDHAGKWETSLLMVLFPELVNLDLMKGKQNRLMAVEGIDPKESSKEYGNEILEKILKFFPFFFETKSE